MCVVFKVAKTLAHLMRNKIIARGLKGVLKFFYTNLYILVLLLGLRLSTGAI